MRDKRKAKARRRTGGKKKELMKRGCRRASTGTQKVAKVIDPAT